ncbi:hypothetical protein F5887DRAFT_953793 [Amanita rubescens]|nr:hypothetical protein F5887DRAFT_953793 [Amanita rubescens]
MFTKVVSFVFLALPFIAQSVTAASCSRTYVVKEGDICDGIGGANNVSTYQLAAVNQGVIDPSCANLKPGKTICLGMPGEDCTTTYTVGNGDTCDGIQTKTGINATLLHTNNPQINHECTNIYIGEVLCIANVVAVPATPSNGAAALVVPPSNAVPANPSATAVHTNHTSTITHAPMATPSSD